ncbi:MAG: MotA/TolQ/ExbB proton channel family protein [Campylobacteraceae bacterium]|jgi:hypothetical protein|nr:MotA/TolQ/ExbB proton channel family protein [Campylobacteraceae bacterium]
MIDTIIQNIIQNKVIYLLIFGWLLFSSYIIYKLHKNKDTNTVNLYVYDAIPTVFASLGVLGTFLGIFDGLQEFDINSDITNSIGRLLEGLKTAFLTSIIGIFLSLVFGRISEKVLDKAKKEASQNSDNEILALNKIANILLEMKNDISLNFKELHRSLTGDDPNSVSMQLVKINNKITEFQIAQITKTNDIVAALGGDNETSLLSQIQKMRSEQSTILGIAANTLIDNHKEITLQTAILNEITITLGRDNKTSLLNEIQLVRATQNDFSATTQKNIDFIVTSMKENREYIAEKFKEFADLLAKSNTEKLVEAMKTATEQFNAQMKELIDKLIKENFDELNKSVGRMNEWQQENKEMIKTLTEQFITVSQNLALSAQSIKEITQNTDKLTNDNSILKRLIEELQKVMIEDKKFSAIATQLEKAVSNTENTTTKLQEWIKDEKHFSESVKLLLNKLEDVEKIKDINEIFWQNLKEQLEKGVGMIETANRDINKGIRDNLQALDNSFESRLVTTFENLDKLIARALQYYHDERLNK